MTCNDILVALDLDFGKQVPHMLQLSISASTTSEQGTLASVQSCLYANLALKSKLSIGGKQAAYASSQYRKCLKNRRGSTWDLYLSCSGGSIEPLSFRRWQPHQPRRGDQFRICNAILLKFYFFHVCGTWIRVDSHLDWDVFRWISMGSLGVSCTITHHEPQTSWPLNSVDQDLLKCSVPCKLIFRTSSVRRLVCSLPLALWVVVIMIR